MVLRNFFPRLFYLLIFDLPWLARGEIWVDPFPSPLLLFLSYSLSGLFFL